MDRRYVDDGNHTDAALSRVLDGKLRLQSACNGRQFARRLRQRDCAPSRPTPWMKFTEFRAPRRGS